MARGTVTVIMAVYNVAATITETLRSVTNQTYKDLSILIIDDGSTDGSDFILKNYAKEDPRIIYVQMKQHQGISYVRNYGIDHAKSDWIAFLDGDDLWREDKIEKQVSMRDRMMRGDVPMYLDNGDPNPDFPAIIFSGTAYKDYKGNPYGYILHVPEKITYKKLLKQNVMSFSSILLHRDLVLSEKFPVDGNLHEDFYTWLRILKQGFCAYGIDEPLLTYRLDRDSKSGNKWAAAKMNYNVYKKLRFGRIKSFYYMCCYARRNTAKYRKIKKS